MAALAQGIGHALDFAHPLLSALHFAAYTTGMPLHAHLQPICCGGHQQARPVQGILACREANLPLPSLGRQWLRPSAIMRLQAIYKVLASSQNAFPSFIRALRTRLLASAGLQPEHKNLYFQSVNCNSVVLSFDTAPLVSLPTCSVKLHPNGYNSTKNNTFYIRTNIISKKVTKFASERI